MTREIEARLKLSAVDRTAAAFKTVGGRMAEVDRKARAISAASSQMTAMQGAMASRAVGLLVPTAIAAGAAKSFATYADVDRRITRIGITADASAEAVGGIRTQLSAIARETATPMDQVTSGLEDMVSQGKTLEDALAFLPAVTRTAAASGADVRDMAASTGALADSLKIAAPEMQRAFDILVAGGKAGKFELKDMSQYLPSLAPMAAAVGLKGTAGLQRLTAMLQIVRNQTGNASEAATNLTNVFQKMESEETAKKFSKFGVDLRKEMAKARKDGKDLTDVFLDLSEKALKGDLSKVPQLFQDMQVAGGMRALLSQRDALRKLQSSLADVDGTTMKDFAKVADDARASIDRLSNSWERFVVNTGRTVSNAGLTGLLETLSEAMDRNAKIVEAEQRGKGGGKEQFIRQSVADGMTRADAEALWAVQAGDTERTTAEKAKVSASDQLESQRRTAAASAEMARIDKIRGKYGSEPLPAILQAQYDAAKATLDREPRDYGQRYAPVVDRGRLAAGEAQRYRPAPEAYPLPRSRPADLGMVPDYPLPRARPEDGAAAIAPAMEALVAEIDRQGGTAVERARAIWGQIDAIFRQPITPNIQMPRAPPLDTGRSFKNGDFTGAP